MLKPIEIHTERLLLKGIAPSFIHHLFQTANKETIMQYFGLDEPGYAQYKTMHEQGMETDRISLFTFLVVNKADHSTMGECGFHTWNKTHQRAELYYFMRKDAYKQQGYMRETLPAVLDYGFTTMGLHRVEALIAKENIPSLRLLLRFGFTREATVREDYIVNGQPEDSECYSLLKHEWDKARALH